jgi:hypothetical protein
MDLASHILGSHQRGSEVFVRCGFISYGKMVYLGSGEANSRSRRSRSSVAGGKPVTTSSLSELLQKKKESYEAEARKNKEIIDEWVDAVGKLFAQLRAWLATSDPTQILQIKERKEEVNEPNVGRYQIPRLEIRAFGIWVAIIPKARKTVKTARPPKPHAPERATGRVDITDEIHRYVLYRFHNEDGDSWFIESPSSSPLSDSLEEFTQERFEEVLKSYFQ